VRCMHVCMYRQFFHLKQSLLETAPSGLHAVDGAHHNNLYTAGENDKEIYHAWAPWMNMLTADVETHMLAKLEYPANAKVLDCAGETGLGAVSILSANPSKNLNVTVLDQAWKEADARKRFAANGFSENANFVSGDVLQGVPQGYDVIQFKHFINMFSQENCITFLTHAYNALPAGGKLVTFTYHCPENFDNGHLGYALMFTYFVACAMGKGGYWKISEVVQWLNEIGFVNIEVIHIEKPHSLVVGYKP